MKDMPKIEENNPGNIMEIVVNETKNMVVTPIM